MRRPYGPVDNPDVIDQRGAPAPPLPSGVSVEPVMLQSEADRRVRGAYLAGGLLAVGAFLIGWDAGQSRVRRARVASPARSSRSRLPRPSSPISPVLARPRRR